MMDSARWERIQVLFHEAASRPASQRLPFLESECDDPQLIEEVTVLLEEDFRGSSLLDGNMAQIAGRMLGSGTEPRLPFEELGPYTILKLLGEGGMGVVYLAEREDLGNVVAIKFLRDAWLSPSRRQRFASERRTLAQLTHPAIARLYDADTLSDGTPWFAMEYINGVTLTEFIGQTRRSTEERLKLFRAVCEAVQYAHSRAVIHRDLKPSNILVQADGCVKLLDFGIAKHLDERDMTPGNQTRTALRLMTPAYAAPEQIRGGPVGTYTDVYALGVILYELLAGQPPFDLAGCSAGEAEMQIVSGNVERPSQVAKRSKAAQPAAASWNDLDVLCLTAMQKEAERRYGSVDALIRDIDRYLAGEPLDARPDTVAYRAGKFIRRNRRPVALAALMLVSVAALVIFYTFRLAAARNAALAEAARTQRVLRFTLNLFEGGDQAAGPASELRVTTLIDRGIGEARSLDREPEVQAELYQTLGEVYQKLGALDRADTLLNSALNERRSLFGNNDTRVAESLVKLGLLRAEQAKLEQAERLVREGLAITKQNRPPDNVAIASATHALGRVLEERGAYAPAIQVLDEAVRLRSAPAADKADLAASLLELANNHFYAGHYTEAETLNRRLLVMHRQIYGDRHPLIAEDLINLGAIQQELGHYQEAEKYDRQALDIFQSFYGKDHFKTASCLTLVARALLKENRTDEAVELLNRALAIQENVFGEMHPRVASAVNELGTVALIRSRFEEAEADFRRMADIYRSVYNGKHYLIGVALANLGSVYMARNDNARAETLFREALAMYAQTLPPGNLNEAITRTKLGRVLLRQKRFAEAEVQTLAGYQVLSKQASPMVSWLQNARQDLTAIYTGLREPGKAKGFAVEQAALTRGSRVEKK